MTFATKGRALALQALFSMLPFAAHLSAQDSGAAPLWDESVDGPLSSDEAAPTVLSLTGGSNIIAGEVAANVDDHFSFRVPKGYGLMFIALKEYASMEPLAWIGLQEGEVWTAGHDSEETAAGILAEQYFGAANVGLGLLATGFWPPPDVYWPSWYMSIYPFHYGAPPIEQDTTYTFKIEQRGTRSSYRLELFLVGLPEPPPTPVITSPKVAQATFGRPFAYKIRSSIPVYWSGAGELPPGLQLDTSTGWIRGKPLKAGTFEVPLYVTSYPEPPYGTGTGKLTLNVAPGAHRIRFAQVPTQIYGPGNTFFLHASSSAGCPVYFYSLNPNTVSVTGNVATIHRAGKVAIVAAGGDENYATATATQNISIFRQRQHIEFDLPSVYAFTKNERVPLEGSSFSGLPVKYSTSDRRVVSIDGSSAVIRGKGLVTITAWQPGDDNYLPAKKVARTIRIN